MKRMLTVLTIACGPLLSVSRAEEAQAPPAPAIIAGFLGFSDIQAARFAQLLGGLRASVGLQDFMEALVSLLKQTPVDESRVMSQLDKILSSEREIKPTQISLMVRIKNRLTTDQQVRLHKLRVESK